MARPKEYNRDDALRAATMLFWERGFERTSMQDLTEAMKISRSSIYDEFGSKEALFLEALQAYALMKTSKREAVMKASIKDPKQAILKLFDSLIEGLYANSVPDGCLLTETAANLSEVNLSIRQYVETQLDVIETSYLKLIQLAREQKQIHSKLSDEALAYILLSLHEGFILLSGIDDDIEKQKVNIRNFMDMI